MRRACIFFLLVAMLGSGCASLSNWHSNEEFVLEVTGYRLWKEVYYLDGRTEMQWLFVCRTISPEKRQTKVTGIVVTERSRLFNCPTGTVMKCQINRRAIDSWESVAKREGARLDLKESRSRAVELEQKALALEQAQGRDESGPTDAADARQEADEAKNQLRQAELYAGAVVVNASDVVMYEVIREGPRR